MSEIVGLREPCDLLLTIIFMERHPAFIRSRAVSEWQEELRRTAHLSAAEAHELQTHLTESCDDLERRGLSPAEAFWLARRRLGDTSAIADEFAKIDGLRRWRERWRWLLAGIVASYVCTSTFALFTTLLTRGLPKWGISVRGVWSWLIEGAAFALMVGMVLAISRQIARRESGEQRIWPRRADLPIGLLGVISLAALCFGISWLDSRLISAQGGDAFGAMLFAGCAIERVTASMMNALLVASLSVTGVAIEIWFRRFPRRRREAFP